MEDGAWICREEGVEERFSQGNHDASLSPVVLRVCTLDRTWRRERASAFLPTASLRRAVVSAVRGVYGSSVSLAWKRRRG